VHGAALRCLREGSLCRSQDQPRAQADEAAVASQPRLDAGNGCRQGSAHARVHPLPQGRKGHEGHLSICTTGRGPSPLPDEVWWEAATPHRRTAALLLLLLGLLLHRVSHPLPCGVSLSLTIHILLFFCFYLFSPYYF